MRCLRTLNPILKEKRGPADEESFSFLLKTFLEDDGEQGVFIRGKKNRVEHLLRVNEKPMIAQITKTDTSIRGLIPIWKGTD